jgi:hypothetical protein
MTGPCLICGTTPPRLHSDHCHRHDRKRGRICPRCNGLMRYLDSGKAPRVPEDQLQKLIEHAARCPGCAAGKPASATPVHQLHLGLGDDLEKFLKGYAEARGITVAAAVRVILYEAKKNEEEKP